MDSKSLRSNLFRLFMVCLAWMALPLEAGMARSVAEIKAEADDAAYQKLVDATNAVVAVKVKAITNARSNESLGRDRGFGLVKPIGRFTQKPIRLGTASPISQLDRLMIVNGGAEQTASIATVVSRRQFAGYWEYLIDFTSPPRLDHSGAALINKDGELVGIGSLFVLDALTPGEKLPGNMFVPVDLLRPILDELVRTGSQQESRRPWLGVNSLEEDGRVKVMQVNEEGPAASAGIEAGDIILSIQGQPVQSLARFYNALWTTGPAGTDVRLKVLHGVTMKEVTVRSIDRREFVRRKQGI